MTSLRPIDGTRHITRAGVVYERAPALDRVDGEGAVLLQAWRRVGVVTSRVVRSGRKSWETAREPMIEVEGGSADGQG